MPSLSPDSEEQIVSFLKATRLFGHLCEETLRRVAHISEIVRYEVDEPIWKAGDLASRLNLVKRGVVQAVKTNSNGHSSIVGLFGAKEAIGLPAVLIRGNYPATALPLSAPVEVMHVDYISLLNATQSDLNFVNSLNQAMIETHQTLHRKIEILSAGNVSFRLKALFKMLSERFGDELEDGMIVIPIFLTRLQISTLIGARTETIIRELSRWQKENNLTSSSSGFMVKSSFLFSQTPV